MRCHGLKGGIGSASRVVELDGKNYTIGALVLSNHAMFDDLIVGGTPIQQLLEAHIPPHEDKGSIITVLATDIPLSERQLRRLCHRALVGLSRTGSYCGNGSGEIVMAFTTANRMPHYADKAILPMTMLHDDAINPLFRAVAECVEESVLSSLFHAETVTGHHGKTVPCLTDLLEQTGKPKNRPCQKNGKHHRSPVVYVYAFTPRFLLPHAVAEGAQLFAQRQIFAVAVDDEPGFVEAELAVLVQQALVHIAGRDLGQEQVVAAQRDDLRHPAFQIDRAFLQNGAVRQHRAGGGVEAAGGKLVQSGRSSRRTSPPPAPVPRWAG